jgi:hypothetical protein
VKYILSVSDCAMCGVASLVLRSNEKTIAFLTAKIAAARAYCNALYGIRDTVAGNKHGTTAAVRERERAGVRKTAVGRGRSAAILRYIL